MNRTILHSDMNNFYASVECLYRPELRNVPMAVLGDPSVRHGIVLAKNGLAKAAGVRTGETMWQARQKCPGIVFTAPHFDRYMYYSAMAREIYAEYTDRVEPFGLDECWLDVTGSRLLFGTGSQIADKIRCRIRTELGLTVSVGVSFNKIFAKLGSDMKKPDAVTVIGEDNFREIVWKLPAEELLFVGSRTLSRLHRIGIFTIGDLAAASPRQLLDLLGKNGPVLWRYANGIDQSPVAPLGAAQEIASVGNSMTLPRDLTNEDEVRLVLMMLCDKVSGRLRAKDLRCRSLQISIRTNDLHRHEHGAPFPEATRSVQDLFLMATALFRTHHDGRPVRSLGVRASELENGGCFQLSLLDDGHDAQREEALEAAVDALRRRYGRNAVNRGIVLTDRGLSGSG